MDLLVEAELRIVQGDAREQPILLQQVVRDPHLGEEVLLVEGGELLATLKEKIELRRQRAGARSLVEALEGRVLRRIHQHRLSREALGETPGEARLADAYRPFHHDELVLSPVMSHAPSSWIQGLRPRLQRLRGGAQGVL